MTQSLIGSEQPINLEELLGVSVEEALADTERAAVGAEDEDLTVQLFEADEADEASIGEDVVLDIAIAAATLGKQFDGPAFGDALAAKGPIEDVRLTLAIEVLRLGSKVTGDKVLDVLDRLGFSEEAAAARVAKTEIEKAPEAAVVESTTVVPNVEVEA